MLAQKLAVFRLALVPVFFPVKCELARHPNMQPCSPSTHRGNVGRAGYICRQRLKRDAENFLLPILRQKRWRGRHESLWQRALTDIRKRKFPLSGISLERFHFGGLSATTT